MKTWIASILSSTIFVFIGLVWFENTTLGQRIVNAWHANDDLRYQIHHAKVLLVEDFLEEVSAKISSVEPEAGSYSLWLDGAKNHPKELRGFLRSDPDGIFERAQYALKRAWNVELIFNNEQAVFNQKEVSKRTSLLIRYRDKYAREAGDMATRQAKRYADCLSLISNAMNAKDLDNARLSLPHPAIVTRLIGSSNSE